VAWTTFKASHHQSVYNHSAIVVFTVVPTPNRSFPVNHYITPDLCDAYPELVQVLEPMFSNFGGRDSFGGEIVTIKCFEDNSRVKEQAELNGEGKVLVVDGGGSLRHALLGDMIADRAAKNGWEGIVIYGCIRDVDVLAQTDLGVQALASHPLKSNRRGVGDVNVLVTFAGVTFRPGEFIYADNNGVIISPTALKMPG
jgi:RraA famliy